MSGDMGGASSSLDKLLTAWGIQFDTGKVVADLNFKMQLRGQNGQPAEAPAWLALTPEGINSDDMVTSQIDNIWLPLCGAFTGNPVAGLRKPCCSTVPRNRSWWTACWPAWAARTS